MEFGADIVVHSTTKYVDGQGRCLGGMILCREDFLKDHLQTYLRNTGPSISPFNAWVHLKALETLDLRMRAHCANALEVANFLAGQERSSRASSIPSATIIRSTSWPGRRCLAAAVSSPSRSMAARRKPSRFARALELIDISNNLGDAKSLLTHPATTTHQRLTPEARAELGITDGMLRLSVGLEDPADLCEDLARALAVV